MPICTEPTATGPTPMADMPMVPTLTPMELTTERGPLMPSPRLMLMPTCMELMELTATVPTPMEDTPMVPTLTPMELTTERGLLMRSPRLMLMPTCMVLMAMVPTLTPMEAMPMVPTLMPMGSMESNWTGSYKQGSTNRSSNQTLENDFIQYSKLDCSIL